MSFLRKYFDSRVKVICGTSSNTNYDIIKANNKGQYEDVKNEI